MGYGGRKVAQFDMTGQLLKERPLKNGFDGEVDAGRYFSRESMLTDEKMQVWTLKLVEFDMDGAEKAIDLLQAENIEMIRNPTLQSAFADEWGTPRFFFAADAATKSLYCGLNTKYQISVKDYSGRTVLVIEKAHDYVKVSRADVGKLMSWALKNERMKWVLSAYPDELIAVKSVTPLPRGNLGVIRVAGVKKLEVDIFDPQGRYLYTLIPPPEVNLDKAQFFSTGFATIDEVEDEFVYHEYRIKNLPEIFGK
jgi:hypothetical protein